MNQVGPAEAVVVRLSTPNFALSNRAHLMTRAQIGTKSLVRRGYRQKGSILFSARVLAPGFLKHPKTCQASFLPKPTHAAPGLECGRGR
jgi:hypothetical protein